MMGAEGLGLMGATLLEEPASQTRAEAPPLTQEHHEASPEEPAASSSRQGGSGPAVWFMVVALLVVLAAVMFVPPRDGPPGDRASSASADKSAATVPESTAAQLRIDEEFFAAFVAHLKLEALRGQDAARRDWKLFAVDVKEQFGRAMTESAKRWEIQLNPNPEVWIVDDWRRAGPNAPVLLIARSYKTAARGSTYLTVDAGARMSRGAVGAAPAALTDWDGRGVRLSPVQIAGGDPEPQ